MANPNDEKDMKRFVGYFSSSEQTTPEHDPGIDINCLFCMKPLKDFPVMTPSILMIGGNKSLFYRCHKKCYQELSDFEIGEYETSMMDAIK